MQTHKPWYKSKTVAFNVVAAVILFAVQAVSILVDNPELQALIPAEKMPILTAIVLFGNLFLRTITNQGITLRNGGGRD